MSKVYSPRSIVIRTKLSWKRHCKVLFDKHCEVHDVPSDLSNDMTPQPHGRIAAVPTGNKFFCVDSGLILKRHNFTKYNMPDRAIKKVNA